MARGALRLEQRAASVGIADDDVHLTLAGAAADRETMKKGGDVGDLRRHQHEWRHAFVGTSAKDDLADALAFVVEEHDVRAHQVGAAVVTTTPIRSVTERAVDGEERFAAFNRRGIRNRALRIGNETALAALGRRTTGASGSALGRRTLLALACGLSALACGLRRHDAEPQRDAAEHTPVRATSVHGRSNSSK